MEIAVAGWACHSGEGDWWWWHRVSRPDHSILTASAVVMVLDYGPFINRHKCPANRAGTNRNGDPAVFIRALAAATSHAVAITA